MIDDRHARGSAASSHVDALLAWTADGVVGLYFAWMSFSLWRNTDTFARMFAGLGAQLPTTTRFVVEHGAWFYPAVFAILLVVLVGKEFLIRDKRISTMATFLMACVGQFAFHALTTVYYLPMFDMMRKLAD